MYNISDIDNWFLGFLIIGQHLCQLTLICCLSFLIGLGVYYLIEKKIKYTTHICITIITLFCLTLIIQYPIKYVIIPLLLFWVCSISAIIISHQILKNNNKINI